MSQTVPGPNRRKAVALLAVLALAAGYAGFSLWSASPVDFEFHDLERPAGFRTIKAGSVSAVPDPFAGLLPETGARDSAPSLARVEENLCNALFGTAGLAEGIVPVAVFSDYQCPYCRVLAPILEEVSEADGNAPLRYHELPIFGPVSEMSARAALAAGEQDSYLEFSSRLMGSAFVPNPAYLAEIARDTGVEVTKLQADMQGPEVSRRLAETAALASLFGFRGTPALVVGHTLVEGAITRRQIEGLIALERKKGPPPGCSG